MQSLSSQVMAIVGIEMDQVRRTPQGDVSVPISMAYNHHHDTAVVGKSAALEELDMHELPRDVAGARHYMRLDKGKVWAPTNPTSASGFPTSAMFSDGESALGSWVGARRPFHAFLVPQRVPHGFTPRS